MVRTILCVSPVFGADASSDLVLTHTRTIYICLWGGGDDPASFCEAVKLKLFTAPGHAATSESSHTHILNASADRSTSVVLVYHLLPLYCTA